MSSSEVTSDSDNMTKIVQGGNTFAGNLLRAVIEESPTSNVFLSPFSISLSLTMAMLGAQGNTKNQMRKSLGFENNSDATIYTKHHEMMTEINPDSTKIANRIFVLEGLDILKSFNDILSHWYKVITASSSFNSDPRKAAKQINDWVSKATNEKIPSLVEADQLAGTVMIIANAVHFKSAWVKEFDPKETSILPFHLDPQNEILVKTMYQKNQHRIMYHEKTNCDILELLYKDRKTKMAIFLPREIDGLNKIVENFGPTILNELASEAQFETVKVWMPLFKLEESYSLQNVLRNKLDMGDAFSPGLADFSSMTAEGGIFISEVAHKTFVEVNEEGTEAAAATAVRMTRCIHIDEEFRADRPFLFAILDQESNNVIFVGVLKKPEAVLGDQKTPRSEL